jgi:hypothetical protein
MQRASDFVDQLQLLATASLSPSICMSITRHVLRCEQASFHYRHSINCEKPARFRLSLSLFQRENAIISDFAYRRECSKFLAVQNCSISSNGNRPSGARWRGQVTMTETFVYGTITPCPISYSVLICFLLFWRCHWCLGFEQKVCSTIFLCFLIRASKLIICVNSMSRHAEENVYACDPLYRRKTLGFRENFMCLHPNETTKRHVLGSNSVVWATKRCSP